MKRLSIVVGITLLAVPAYAELTLEHFLDQMTDLEALTTMPDPYYTTKQFSSWDRRSTDPEVKTDENWFGNWDRGRYLRKDERGGETEYVLMEADGPGVIVRFWSANPADAGNVRFYVDGADTPALETPLTTWLGGEHPLAPAPISGVRAAGWNNFLPIPYGESIKVVTTEWDFYYHINYRTYEAGTEIPSFTIESTEAAMAQIEAVAEKLAGPREAVTMPEGASETDHVFDLAAEGKASLTGLEGPAAVYAITGTVKADDLAEALRGVLLEIIFDGKTTVQTPLGDFFGTAPGPNPYDSLPLGMGDDGSFYSHWVMPFKDSMEVRMTNHTDMPVQVDTTFTRADREWADGSLYLHAKFKGERQIETRPRQDWNYLTVDGTGRFAGVALHIANPVADWWGEGDEKIYVDGEDFPSHFGTGTEDYYGYAWCSPEVFIHAYHNQPRCDGPGNYGHTSVNRFHIIDSIPFRDDFKFDMEVWHWAETTVDQSIVAYWYATAASTDAMPEIDPALLTVPVIPEVELMHVENALEGEKLEVAEMTGGRHSVQTSYAWPWSNGAQLWWQEPDPGDTFTLTIPAEEAGEYEVFARFTSAPDYGKATFEVNGEPAGEEMDFYDTTVSVGDEVSLGVHALKAGDNTFTVTITGKHDEAIPKYMVGIDYVRMEKN